MFAVVSGSPAQTQKIGEQLSRVLLPGDVVSLSGDLGAGKTLLVKGIGQGLGIPPALITSPTFSIINEHDQGLCPLYHFDLFRLESALDLEQVGYADYFYGEGITVVEWGGLFAELLPEERLDIVLCKSGPAQRQLRFVGLGDRGSQIEGELRGILQCTF